MMHFNHRWSGALGVGFCLSLSVGVLAGTNYWTIGAGQPQEPIIHIFFHPTAAGVVMASHNRDPILVESTDGGATWRMPMPQPPSDWPMTTIAFDPVNIGTVYAGSERGLYKSTDLGLTWTALTDLNLRVDLVVVDPVKPKILYASGDSVIRKSKDGGMYWQSASIPPYSCRHVAIIIDPVEDKTLYASDLGCGVKKSTDRGESWLSADRGLPPLPYAGIDLGMDPQNHKILYAAVGGTIYRTVDAAQQWTVLGQGPVSDFRFVVDPRRGGVLYAITERVGYRSDDGTSTWTPFFALGEGQGIDPWSFAMDPIVPGRFLACNAGGIIRTVDGGATWQSDLPGLAGGTISRLTANPERPGLLLATASRYTLRSVDGAEHWAPPEPSGGLLGIPTVFAPSEPDLCYNGSTSQFFRSYDWGATFEWVGNPNARTGCTGLAVHPQIAELVFAVRATDEFLRSPDGGVSWINILTTPDCALGDIVLDPSQPTTIYARGYRDSWVSQAGVWKSTDGGVTFRPSSPPFQSATAYALVLDPSTPETLYAGLDIQRTTTPLWKSTDGASTWAPADAGLPRLSVNAIAVDPRSPGTIYAGTAGAGVYRSADGGVSWSPMNEGLGLLDVQALAVEPVAPGRVYCSSSLGGVTVYLPNPTAPLLRGVKKLQDPFRLQVTGANLTPGCVVEIQGVRVPETKYKSSGELMAKKGDALKAMLPKGIPVAVTVYDTATAERSPPFYYVR